MANRTVTLVLYAKTEKGWRYLPPAMGKNRRLRPLYAEVEGVLSHHPEGSYKLRSYEGKRIVYRDVGSNAAVAWSKLEVERTRQAAKADAIAAGIELVKDDGKPTRMQLRQAVQQYIQRTRDRQRPVAAEAYRVALGEFLRSTSKTFADEVTEADVLAFHRHLRDGGNAERTIRGKHIALMGFLRWCKVDVKALAVDAPRLVKKMPTVYTPEELAAFFAALKTRKHKALFSVLLKCGLRMQEAMHLEWPDVDYRHRLLHVRAKKHWNFMLKDFEERSVPLANDVAKLLTALHRERPKSRLVFGTERDLPDWKMLQFLKRRVRVAGLNCVTCDTCNAKDECSKWTLHQFRRTFATMMVRNGLDLNTLMKLMGHNDLATVQRYLGGGDSKTAQTLVQKINWY
jgi:integrase